MKTILYNPIFINPQAYYVFPRLTRYLQPDNESTAEPANYIGTIEVKVIAYGDTTLKRTYTNTDSIDLSEFKNTWIRISLFTKVGSCVLGEWKIGNMESDLPYIDPEVLASLKAVVIVGNKTNNDSDRAIVKNLVDPDNPFVISNAAYTEGSGYADKGSPYYGAFVTDGIDDLITSTKTMQEMLGGSNEITVVSMIHQIGLGCRTNFICDKGSYWRCNEVANTGEGKTGIYGYSSTNISVNTPNIINNVLGDKVDYSVTGDRNDLTPSQFSVVGYISGSTGKISYTSSVAWYWTIIANKVLTTDQINQVIAYFNLDRTLKPDILCNTIKQGITNENHAEFGDRLIDFSGNGRDIQLNNIAWKGDSGIGKYEVDFLDSSIWNSSNSTITSSKIDCKNAISHIMLLYYSVGSKEYPDIPSFKVIKTGADIDYSYIDETGSPKSVRIVDGVNVLPASHNTLYSGSGRFCGFGNPGMGNSVTITQIPSHAGALCLDGVDDFGINKDVPTFTDFTVIAKRTWLEENTSDKPFIIKGDSLYPDGNQNAFLFEYGKLSTYSFGQNNKYDESVVPSLISYATTYSYNGVIPLVRGSATDTIGIDVAHSTKIALYFLMLFPYSMSEFLIERQLKKHKLGTLYPDMVEFRPIVKSNNKWDTIEIWQGDKSLYRPTINDDKTGIYLKKDSTIGIYVKPYVGQKVSEIVYNGVSYTDLKLNSNGFYYKTVPITKSPQKIGITIEQDENYVLFNPVITSNVEYHKLDFYLNNYQKRINIGDYIPKDAYLRANFYLKNNVDELTAFIFNGVNIGYRRSSVDDTAFNIGYIYNYDSPQEVNITIDEYIRYEDIVQPYPVLLRFKDENGNEVSWGGKFKVGSTITRIGSIADPESNLLNGLYSISGLSLNGKAVTSSTSIVEKQMVFKTTATYLLDNNEPKCILSPSRLRIPNSSYKLLGYIPDISGHGNHGKINNSAYAGMSGVNGYPVVFGANKTWANESNGYVTSITSNTIHITNVLNAGLALLYSYVKYNGNLQNIKEIPPFKIEIKGLEGRSKFIYKYLATSDATKETNLYLGNGTHELPKSFLPTEALINNAVVGFSISPIEEGVTNFLSDITIKVLPEYEGAYCLDGVDDFVTIPTTVGGKQVLMKVNWDSSNSALLYDQRGYNNEFAIYNGSADSDGNPIPAYQGRNNGQTYIDGILNSNIKASELRAITHNITITNELSAGVNKFSPVIGSNRVHNAYFTNMALYDFMLFDNISTDDKIKQLNEYVGIEGNTEWRKTK